jgi:hypothetical protein
LISGSTWKVILSCFGIYKIISEKIRENQEFFKNLLLKNLLDISDIIG